MKIAHIVSTYPPYYGGMGNVVFETAAHLSERGHDVAVFTPGIYEEKEVRPSDAPPAAPHEPELKKQIADVRLLKAPVRYGNAAYMPQVKRELSGFDIVHLHYPFFGTAGTVKKFKQDNPDIPLVITYHMDTRGAGWKGLVFKYYAHFAMPRILSRADMIIGSSFDYIMSSDAAPMFHANEKKWRELPFGVDTARFAPGEKSPELFVRYGLDIGSPLVLFVGGMDDAHYFKGVSVLLRAARMIRKRGLSIQFLFAGDGNLRPKYEQEAEMLGLKGDVHFAGMVSNEDLPSVYSMGDVLVLPSLNQAEAFGMVLLEAMASGVPVIASDLPGVRTVAEDGGILVEPGNYEDLGEAIMGYFVEGNDRAAWKKRVREAAQTKYSWEPIVARLEELYRELADA